MKKLLLVPAIGLVCAGLLVVCAVLTTGLRKSGFIIDYITQVFLVSVLLDLLYAMANFVSTHHYAVHLFGGWLCLLSVGQLYLERLVLDGKLEGVDFEERVTSALGGLVVVSRVRDIARDPASGSAKAFHAVNPMHRRRSTSAATSASVELTVVAKSGGDEEVYDLFEVHADGHRETFDIVNPVSISIFHLSTI